MSQNLDNEILLEQLLQERDEMYCELSRYRSTDNDKMKAVEARNNELEVLLIEAKGSQQKARAG